MPVKMSKCCCETNYLYNKGLKGKGTIDRSLLTRRQHEDLLAQPRPQPKSPPPPKRKVKQCIIPKICPPRIDQLAIPTQKLIEGVLQDFNRTLEAERVVRLVNLAHSNRDEKPRYSSQKCRQKKKKKKHKNKKENCLKVWLKKRIKRSAHLVMILILQRREFMPNYRQLLVSMGIFKALRLKRKCRRCMCRYTKTYLMKLCEQLAVYIDMDFTPYKKLPPIESLPVSEVESVESKRHIYWQMREPSEEEEEEEGKEEEEEEKKEEEDKETEVEGEEESSEAAEIEESEAEVTEVEGGVGEGEGIKDEEEEKEIAKEIEEEGEDFITGAEGEGEFPPILGEEEEGEGKDEDEGEGEDENEADVGGGTEGDAESPADEGESPAGEGESSPEADDGAGTEQENEGEEETTAGETAVEETEGEESEKPEGETTVEEGEEDNTPFEGEVPSGNEEIVSGEEVDVSPDEGEVEVSPEEGEVETSPEEGEAEVSPEEGEVEVSPEEGEVEVSPDEGDFEYIEGEEEYGIEEGEEEITTAPIEEGEEAEGPFEEGIEEQGEEALGEEVEGEEEEEIEIVPEGEVKPDEISTITEGEEEILVEEHPPESVSYLTCQVYASWLDEFSSNIVKYGKCLRRFREILEVRSIYYTDTIAKILNNWGTYLKDSREFEKNMTKYLVGRPVTKCAKCGEYTLYNIPPDHDIPPELKVAVDSTVRWKQILDEAEKLCEMYTAEPEDTMSMASHETVQIIDAVLATSDTSMYVFEDFLPNVNNSNDQNNSRNNNRGRGRRY